MVKDFPLKFVIQLVRLIVPRHNIPAFIYKMVSRSYYYSRPWSE